MLASSYKPWELVVVDNGSTDGTCDWLREFEREAAAADVKLSVIANDGNIGCSTSRNQGAAQASGEKLVFIDNDVAVRSRNWLCVLGEHLDDSGDTAVVGPKLVYPFEPHMIQCAGAAVSRAGRIQFVGRGEPREDPRFNALQEVQCLISACFMLRSDAFEEAGGFDEAFNPVEFEDIDLCYRIRSKGHKIIYDPTVEMYHFESVTTAGTAALPNTRLIIEHGLLFQDRWRHMFSKEDGPPEEDTRWRIVKTRQLADVCELPMIG